MPAMPDQVSGKPHRLLSKLSQALNRILQLFSRVIKATSKPPKEPGSDISSDIPPVVRELDNLHVRLRMWMEDIIREDLESDGGVTFFDALDILGEGWGDAKSAVLQGIFDAMNTGLEKLQGKLSDPGPGSGTRSVKLPRGASRDIKTDDETALYIRRALLDDIQTLMSRLDGLKKVVRDELSMILRHEIHQSGSPDGSQTVQSILCLGRQVPDHTSFRVALLIQMKMEVESVATRPC
jgi:hypothetical protein